MYQWHLLTIGHLSRNKFWGEGQEKGVHGVLATSCVLKGHGEVIVVDPSLPAAEMAQALFDGSGIRAEQVTKVYSTHFHFDHHVSYEAFPAAQWYMAPGDLAYLQHHWDEYSRIWSMDSLETIQRVQPAPQTLCEGITLHPMCGHTEGLCALCFDGPEGRVAATGDAIMNKEFYAAGESYFFASHSVEECARNLKAFYGKADVIIPGHGEAFVARAFEPAVVSAE